MKTVGNDFPHPVLSGDSDDYTTGAFNLKYTYGKVDESFVFQFKHELTCEGLKQIIDLKKAKIVIRVECSFTSFRRIYIFENPMLIININQNDVRKSMKVEGFIVSTQIIENFSLPEHNSLYFRDVNFSLRKGDILAFTNTERIFFDDPEFQKPIPSVFEIIEDVEMNEMLWTNLDQSIIQIHLKSELFEMYSNLRGGSQQDYLNSVIVYPVLIEALEKIKRAHFLDETEDLNDYQWYQSIKTQLKTKFDIDLSDDMGSTPALANKLLGFVVNSSLNNIVNLLNWDNSDEDD